MALKNMNIVILWINLLVCWRIVNYIINMYSQFYVSAREPQPEYTKTKMMVREREQGFQLLFSLCNIQYLTCIYSSFCDGIISKQLALTWQGHYYGPLKINLLLTSWWLHWEYHISTIHWTRVLVWCVQHGSAVSWFNFVLSW